MRLLLALVIPSLFWDGGADTAPMLTRNQITSISVPAAKASEWEAVAAIKVTVVDAAQFTKVQTPSLAAMPANESGATRRQWVNSNGWRFLRNPLGDYVYDAPGDAAALAAAESFMFGAKAVIRTDNDGVAAFGSMLTLLRTLDGPRNPPLGNIGFIDDGTEASAEFMNLLVRRNLLFKVVAKPDPKMAINVKLGAADYPQSEAGQPNLLAERVRDNLTDERRILRIYGNEDIVGRLEGSGGAARLYLLNYGGTKQPVHGVRIRVQGRFPRQKAVIAGDRQPELKDVRVLNGATEFTITKLDTLAVVDLTQ